VVVSDTLPTGVTYDSDDGGGAYDSGTGVWNIPGTIGLGISATLRITATVDAGTAGTTITNTATITDSDQTDTVPGNDEDDAAITVTEIDLAISKTVDDSTPQEGQTIVYAVTVSNNGPDDASGVVVSDTLPSGVTHSLDDGAGTYSSTTGVWNVPGIIGLGISTTLRITATVDAGTAGTTITNTATITDADQADTVPSSDKDNAAITVAYTPVLTITKDGPLAANVGDTAVYTFSVSHDATSDGSAVSSVTVTDTVAGTAILVSGDTNTDDELDLGETWVFTASYTVQPTDPDPLLNVGTVKGTDGDGDDITADSNTHSMAVEYAPALSIAKDGPLAANVGNTVVYTFTVSHDIASDGSPVSSVIVTDTIAGTATLVSGDTNTDDELDLGETWVFTASYTIQITDPDPLLNTGTVSGQDEDGDDVPSAEDTHSTALGYAPFLTIVKDGPLAANVDDTVVYSFTVSHDATSDGSAVSSVTVIDTVAGTATLASGDTNTDDELDLGETWVFTTSYTVQPTDPDPLLNTGTVTGKDLDNSDVIANSNIHSLDVEYGPALTITKDGLSIARIGDMVVYTFTVSHDVTSDGSPVSNVGVVDTVAGTAALFSGDTDTDGELDAGETWVYTATYTIQPGDPDPLVNTGTVSGTDSDGDDVTADSNTHSITLEYVLTVNRVGRGSVELDPDQPTYRYGDKVTLTAIADLGWTFAGWSGDLGGTLNLNSIVMDGDKVVTATFTQDQYTLTVNRVGDGSVTKDPDQPTYVYGEVVTLTAIPDPDWRFAGWSGDLGGTLNLDTILMDGDKVVTATFTAIEYTPALTITKDGPDEARVGENVVYTFTVIHAPTSDGSPLHTVSVTDSIAGPATLVSGDDGDDELELGETWVFTAGYHIQVTDPNPLVNVGTVVAKDANGDDVSAQDMHSTTVGQLTYLPIVMRAHMGLVVR
jgi:uncharacterized repeat protein (TIGR01451 family)/uncharacterized repeat protein (TIGR02543 family)